MAVSAAALPDDALAGVLGRLPPRSLAAARLVCTAWRALVDDRRLLLPHLLPHSVGGLFVSYMDHETPHFFARPPPAPPAACAGPAARIDGGFGFAAPDGEQRFYWHSIVDHCNSLVLFSREALFLCNPATRWWARLPPLCSDDGDDRHWGRRAFVVFDPAAVPPHWEVLLAPREPHEPRPRGDDAEGDGDEEEEYGDISEDDDGDDEDEKEEEKGEEDIGGTWRTMEWQQEHGHGEISEEDGGGAWRTMEWQQEHGHGEISEDDDGDDQDEKAEEEEHGEISEEDGGGGAWRTMEWQQEHGEIAEDDGGTWRMVEWPPEAWTWHVISSRTMRWEERAFVREGEAAGTVAGLLLHSLGRVGVYDGLWRYSAYRHGALYVHCRGEFVSRLSLSTNEYRVIRSPIDLAACHQGTRSFLGRSGNGVCFAALDGTKLRVWILDESGDEMEWQLKHHSMVNIPDYEQLRSYVGRWVIDDFYEAEGGESLEEHNDGWDSDDDDVIGGIVDDDGDDKWGVMFLGFNPYKEVVFMTEHDRGFAYHLDSKKIQYLGKLYTRTYHRGLYESVVFTPCLIGV
ncbi:unnamed protein product [Urochloa decumbens]|uniref:F-box domain-containing protein n=1 Tax=Urochloa decumbens TaxID=240449 RepID=A0ABC9B207_9POAL